MTNFLQSATQADIFVSFNKSKNVKYVFTEYLACMFWLRQDWELTSQLPVKVPKHPENHHLGKQNSLALSCIWQLSFTGSRIFTA